MLNKINTTCRQLKHDVNVSIPKTLQFTKDSEMKKCGSGCNEQFVSQAGLCLVKWYDNNKPIYLGSSAFGVQSEGVCER